MPVSKWQAEQDAIAAAIAKFPATFGLTSAPGELFCISKTASYVNDAGVVILYTCRQSGAQWFSYAKGTVAELESNINRGVR